MSAQPTETLLYRTLEPRDGPAPHPAVLLLHGRGSNELDLLSLGHALDPRLYVFSPRAPYALGPGSYYWYDLEASLIGRASPEDLKASLGLVGALIDELLGYYPVDPALLFMGGFSMGGAMTAATLLTRPEQLAGAIILSGYVPLNVELDWETAAASAKPVFQAHGMYDDVLPIQFGRMSRDFLQQQTSVALTYREYPIAHQVSAAELADASTWLRPLLPVPRRSGRSST